MLRWVKSMNLGASSIKQRIKCPTQDIKIPLVRLNEDKVSAPEDTYANYAVTHMHHKNSNIQGKSPNVVRVISHTIRNCF